jgi:predicted DNA-binding transcriptional regulator AlpA
MSPIELVDEARACHVLGGSRPISRATLYRGVRSGRYPKPLKVGPATNRWRMDELQTVLEKATAAREIEAA